MPARLAASQSITTRQRCVCCAAGDADIMHPCVGRAVRMMVPRREQQAEILVQAVQNHNPQVLIVDEIGTKEVRDHHNYES